MTSHSQTNRLNNDHGVTERLRRAGHKDGNGAVSGRISAGFGSCGFGFGDDFSPTVFGFGAPKPIEFGFGFVHPWISNGYLK